MTRMLTRRAGLLAIGIAPLAAAGPAFADRCSGPVTVEEAIRIARGAGVASVEEVECDDGRWEVEGRDARGREIEVDIDARTGRVIKVERDD